MTDIKFTLHPVFPRPIYRTFLKKGLSKKDIDFAIKINDLTKNYGNNNSKNAYVLDQKRFYNLKKEL